MRSDSRSFDLAPKKIGAEFPSFLPVDDPPASLGAFGVPDNDLPNQTDVHEKSSGLTSPNCFLYINMAPALPLPNHIPSLSTTQCGSSITPSVLLL